MRKQIEKILKLTTFFNVKQCSNNNITVNLETPSLIVLQNIHKSWLQSIYAKTHQHYTVYLNKGIPDLKYNKQKLCYGYIDQCLPNQVHEINIDYHSQACTMKRNSELRFTVIIPQQDAMQSLIQWQTYRKYWWSWITTSPGLFSVIDVKYGDENGHASISADFKWDHWIVETIKVSPHSVANKSAQLCCTMSLENSLITLLLDATTSSKEEYLKLHNKMAPYKFSFALNYKDKCNFTTLQELAAHIFNQLQSNKISTWLPEFSLPLEPQIKENMQLGVTYTAILSEDTLTNGIFHLMNSSTMLKEQVHLADFTNYAALLCGKRT